MKKDDSPLTNVFSFEKPPKVIRPAIYSANTYWNSTIKRKAPKKVKGEWFLRSANMRIGIPIKKPKKIKHTKLPKKIKVVPLENQPTFSKRKQTGRIPTYINWGSKYHNTPSRYKGVLYMSKKEMEYAMILDDMKRTKEIDSWKGQFTLKLDVNGKHICNYIADFKVVRSIQTDNGGFFQEEIHEVKGFFTPISKLKWRLAQALYPQYKFVLIK